MANAAVFIITNFEETECVTTVDLLRRGQVETTLVSLGPELLVKGSRGINVQADILFKDLKDPKTYDILVIIGGTLSYLEHPEFMKLIGDAGKAGQKIAAICIAPVVLGVLGLLKGKKVTCYPDPEGEKKLEGATLVKERVVTSGNITTSRGPATATFFAIELIKILQGQKIADKVQAGILLDF
ncbi:MAG: DJ-1/PfpI family protein [Deltaproteobacteria bacterium]|jgi:4-methyl-5(b-hydroxyethyl)-thiazole monophosphate biosynthesis|nr:DJ-1/PfpI family protein [Deltaproteobacteria bacterium]